MTIQELFILSNQALRNSVDQIADDQWLMNMPPGTSGKPTNLQDAVRYHTYDASPQEKLLAMVGRS